MLKPLLNQTPPPYESEANTGSQQVDGAPPYSDDAAAPRTTTDGTHNLGTKAEYKHTDANQNSRGELFTSPSTQADIDLDSSHEFEYRIDDILEVNFGPQPWGLEMLAYGYQGRVEGYVRPLGNHHIKSVEIKASYPINILSEPLFLTYMCAI